MQVALFHTLILIQIISGLLLQKLHMESGLLREKLLLATMPVGVNSDWKAN